MKILAMNNPEERVKCGEGGFRFPTPKMSQLPLSKKLRESGMQFMKAGKGFR